MPAPRRRFAEDVWLFTCEHGGHRIPAPYKAVFRGAEQALTTHRGWDIGALAVARRLAARSKRALIYSQVSRLLVDLNRSRGHARVFSEWSQQLDAAAQARVFARYYDPYRAEVAAWIRARVARGQRVVHISVHSFTPRLAGQVRNCEIGLLYDPRRPGELALGTLLQKRLRAAIAATAYDWRVRRNYPYHGAADGLTTALRRLFTPASYVGLEIEMNQAVVVTSAGQRAMAALFGSVLY